MRQWDAYAYADKTRESQRLETLRTQKRSVPDDVDSRQRKKPKSNNVAWSAKADRKVAKELKREKRLEKSKVLAQRNEQQSDDEEGGGEEVVQDWKDLVLEKAGEKRRGAKGTERQDLAVAAFDGMV